MTNRDTFRDLTIFSLLVAIGVVGRWAQPDWNFTPLAAITILGGYYFRLLLPAVLLPVTVLAVSDLVLPTHDSLAVQIAVHAMMILPVVLGRGMRNAEGKTRIALGAACGLVPATAFYLVTNLVHWAATGMYAKSLSGLAACYVAGVPFYRSMLVGDVFYLVVLAGCLALAGSKVAQDSPSNLAG